MGRAGDNAVSVSGKCREKWLDAGSGVRWLTSLELRANMDGDAT
jgi:hypothetical protein